MSKLEGSTPQAVTLSARLVLDMVSINLSSALAIVWPLLLRLVLDVPLDMG